MENFCDIHFHCRHGDNFSESNTMTEMEHLLQDAAKSTRKTAEPTLFRMGESKGSPCTLLQSKFFESGGQPRV